MKKLYRKGAVHPSPLPSIISDQLSFLPATIFTLTLALSPEDREVLAYLLSRSDNFSVHHNHNKNNIKDNNNRGKRARDQDEHPPVFRCSCFRCYKSFWMRWDASFNRELIHEIIDAFEEEEEFVKKRESKGKNKEKMKKGNDNNKRRVELAELDKVQESRSGGEEVFGDEELEKGSSVKKLVSLIGDRIWSIWTYGKNDKIRN